jgi:glutathione S-transferase
MARPIITGNPLSPHVRALALALAEKDVTFSIQGPGHAQPSIQWGDSRSEGALNCLLHIEQSAPRLPLVPTDAAGRASMERVLELYYREAVVTLGRQVAAPYVLAIVVGEVAWPIPEAHHAAALRTVSALEHELGSGRFFGGETLSLADIAVSALYEPLSQMPEHGSVVRPESPLRPWFERMSSRGAFEVTRQDGGSIVSLYLAAASQ